MTESISIPPDVGDTREEKISLLENSIHFFLETVFLLESGDDYRLVVVNKGELVVDKFYKSTRGARIAFGRMFGLKHYKEKCKVDWSHFYTPEKNWLEKKLNYPKAQHFIGNETNV